MKKQALRGLLILTAMAFIFQIAVINESGGFAATYSTIRHIGPKSYFHAEMVGMLNIDEGKTHDPSTVFTNSLGSN